MVADDKIILEPTSPSFLRDSVLNTLREKIVSGVIKPDQRLNESVLARQLGTSRGPVREALMALEREGLVTLNPNRSPRVATFTAEDITELVEVRWLLETYATRKIVGRLEEEDFGRLEELVSQMHEALAEDDRARIIGADLRFHDEIMKLAGNSRLYQIWSLLASNIRLFITLAVETGSDFAGMVDMHEELLQALRANDVEHAVLTINKPNYEVGERIGQMMAKGDST